MEQEREAPRWAEIQPLLLPVSNPLSNLPIDEPQLFPVNSPAFLFIVIRRLSDSALLAPLVISSSVGRACIGRRVMRACQEKGMQIHVGMFLRCHVQEASNDDSIFTHWVNEVVECTRGAPVHTNNGFIEVECECDVSRVGSVERAMDGRDECLIVHCDGDIPVCLPSYRLAPVLCFDLTAPAIIRFRAVLMPRRAGCVFRLVDTAPISSQSGQNIHFLPMNMKPSRTEGTMIRKCEEESWEECDRETVDVDGPTSLSTNSTDQSHDELGVEDALSRLMANGRFIRTVISEGLIRQAITVETAIEEEKKKPEEGVEGE